MLKRKPTELLGQKKLLFRTAVPTVSSESYCYFQIKVIKVYISLHSFCSLDHTVASIKLRALIDVIGYTRTE